MLGTRRFWQVGGAAAVALAAWAVIPGSMVDRLALRTVVRGFANPPFFIAGHGSEAAPWEVRTLAVEPVADTGHAPVVVSLGDDSEGFFQSSPPSPIDLAVILSNFQRLGAKRAGIAVVLAWDSPDAMGMAALDKAIGRFDSLVMAAPLSRGAVPELMPPAFRRSSLPVADVAGDPAALPVVNRIPLPGVVLGGPQTLAGFQVLDSEPASHNPPLLARWDDRVVLAFPLLCALQELNLPVEGVRVRLGEAITLSASGPVVPIDRYGRASGVEDRSAGAGGRVIQAEDVVDAADGLLAGGRLVVLRDDRSAAEPATRGFSGQVAWLVATLASDGGLGPATSYRRLSVFWELAGLAAVLLVAVRCARLDRFARRLGWALVAGVCVSGQWVAAGAAGVWLPGVAALVALGAVVVFISRGPVPRPAAVVAVVPRPPVTRPVRLPVESPAPAAMPVKQPMPRTDGTQPVRPPPPKLPPRKRSGRKRGN